MEGREGKGRKKKLKLLFAPQFSGGEGKIFTFFIHQMNYFCSLQIEV